MTAKASLTFVLASCIALALCTQSVHAQSATIADEGCKEFEGSCQYQTRCDKSQPPSKKNIGIIGKKCADPRGVSGTCTSYGVCKALTASGADGKSMNIGDLSKLVDVLGKVMQALNAGGVGGGSGSPGGTGSTGGYGGCSQYYQVNTPSSDPCAYYVPSASSNINIDTGSNSSSGTGAGSNNAVTDLISNLIGGGSGGSSSSSTGSTGSSGAGSVNIPTSSPSVSGGLSSSTANGAKVVLPDGTSGELRVLPNGATVIVRTQDTGKNSTVAGFLGTQASGGAQPKGLVASWCQTRPWSSNFLSIIIPAKFFDNLCTLNGYQVGIPTPTVQTQIVQSGSNVPRTTTFTQPTTGVRATSTIPQSPPMTVDIWAVPASVPLGARTTIFWNSKNAQSCIETSPDGSFSHATLSGGGATVPLSGATTYTISCTAPDGSHATDYVTVNLSI